jgi:hypothetical protein
MRAVFANLSELTRQHNRDFHSRARFERLQVLALCDAVQIAVARGQHDRATALLTEMRSLVEPVLAKRAGRPLDP